MRSWPAFCIALLIALVFASAHGGAQSVGNGSNGIGNIGNGGKPLYLPSVSPSPSSSPSVSPSPSSSPNGSPTPSIRTQPGSIFIGINNPVGGAALLESQIFASPYPARTFAIHLVYPNWTDITYINTVGCSSLTGNSKTVCQQIQADKAAGRIPDLAWNCGDTNNNIINDANDALDDQVIKASADALVAFNWPVYIRWLWEFNLRAPDQGRANYPGGCYDGPDAGPPTSPTPGPTAMPTTYPGDVNGPDGVNGSTGTVGFFDGPTYAAAYRHIYTVFMAEYLAKGGQRQNVAWVWEGGNQNLTGGGSSAQWLYQYYPGDAYVDWIGIDTYDRSNNGLGYLLDNVAGPIPYPSPGYGSRSPAPNTPYPTTTPTPASVSQYLESVSSGAPTKPEIIDENGAHPDINCVTPPAGVVTGAFQQIYFSGGSLASPWPVIGPFLSLDQVLKNHPQFNAYVYFDKDNGGNCPSPTPAPPFVDGNDWALWSPAPTSPFGLFANGAYESLPAIPNGTPPPTPGPITFVPPSIVLTGPTASPQSVIVNDPLFSGNFTVSPTPAGFVTTTITGSGSGSAINITPVSSAVGSIAVSDGYNTALLPVTVNPAGSPGPVTLSPSGIVLPGPTAAPVNVVANESGFNGTYTAVASPAGIVSTTVTGNTIAVGPASGGQPGTAVVTVTGYTGQSATLPVTVSYNNGPASLDPNLCVGSTEYSLVGDDEFYNNSNVSLTDNQIGGATPNPSATWSTQLYEIGRQNNQGTDTAYYTSQSANGVAFGGYTPYSINYQTGLRITATPVPSPYATASPLFFGASPTPVADTWLSGGLEGQPRTYGYIEWAGRAPASTQGAWPSWWMLGSQNTGTTYTEFDALEYFGTIFGSNVAQQTYIYDLSHDSYYTRSYVQPTPSSVFHTYSLLWTPDNHATFYIDHVPVNPTPYPVNSAGPVSPIMLQQIYKAGQYGQTAPLQPISMDTLYFRWYQTAGQTGCTGHPALPTPYVTNTTPNPTPSAAATSVHIVQHTLTSCLSASGCYSTGTVSFPTMPTNGNKLLVIVEGYNVNVAPGTALQNGWHLIGGYGANPLTAGSQMLVYYCQVGTQCTAATSYNFPGNGDYYEGIEINGSGTTVPVISLDALVNSGGSNPPIVTQLFEAVPGALTLGLYGGAWTANLSPTSFTETLPTGQTSTTLDSGFGNTSYRIAFAVTQMNKEVAQATQAFTTTGVFATPSPSPSPAVLTAEDGFLVTFLPSGATPFPIPSPSLPPTPTPVPAAAVGNSAPTMEPSPGGSPTAAPTQFPPSGYTPTPIPATVVTPLSTPLPQATCIAGGKNWTNLDYYGVTQFLLPYLGVAQLQAAYNNSCTTETTTITNGVARVQQNGIEPLTSAMHLWQYEDVTQLQADVAAGILPSGIGVVVDLNNSASTPGCLPSSSYSGSLSTCPSPAPGGPIANFTANQQYNFGYWYCQAASTLHGNGDWLIAQPNFSLIPNATINTKYDAMFASPGFTSVEKCSDVLVYSLQQLLGLDTGNIAYGQVLSRAVTQYKSVSGTSGKWMVSVGASVNSTVNGAACILVPQSQEQNARDMAYAYGAAGTYNTIQSKAAIASCPVPTPDPAQLNLNLGNYAEYDADASVPTPFPSVSPSPSASPSPLPSPIYTNFTPGPTYPVTIPALPISAYTTIVAEVKCPVNLNGNALMGGAATFGFEAGLCNGGTDNGQTLSAHFYDTVGNKQAQPPTDLSTLSTYMLFGFIDGANVNYIECAIPYTVNDCLQYQTAGDVAAWTPGTITAYVGAASDGKGRIMQSPGHIWNIIVYPTALTIAQANQVAATLATSDPYPTPVPSPSPPIYALQQPYSSSQNGAPFSVSLPTPGVFSYVVQIKGSTSTAGNAIAALGATSAGNAISIEAGQIPATPNPNPSNAAGAHVYLNTGAQAGPTTAPFSPGTTYTVIVTDNGSTLTYNVCNFGGTVACSTTSTAVAAGVTYSTQAALIGAGDVGNDRLFQGDIWNFQIYNYALTTAQVLQVASATTGTYGMIADPYTVQGTGYASPVPAWENNLAWTTKIDATKAANPANLKSYSNAANTLYLNWANSHGGGWGPSEVYNSGSATSSPAKGYSTFYAQSSDPTYNFECIDQLYGSTNFLCGFSTGISNLHIPLGAYTENDGSGNCDCHIRIVEYPHWVPTNISGFSTTWRDIYPDRYVIEMEDAGYGSSLNNAKACSNQSTYACTTFNDSSGTGWIVGGSAVVVSSGGSGWTGGLSGSIDDGWYPQSPPGGTSGKYVGIAVKGGTVNNAGVVTPNDLYYGITHEVMMDAICLQPPQPDTQGGGGPWPGYNAGQQDTLCSYAGGTNSQGYAYEDHIRLNRTAAQIISDVSLGTITAYQSVWALGASQYGFVAMDTEGYSGAPAFTYYMDSVNTTTGSNAGAKTWADVASKYGWSTAGDGGYNVPQPMPIGYFLQYAQDINSCVIPTSPTYANC